VRKVRLDNYLVSHGFAHDLKEAMGLILSGRVRLGSQVLDKPGMLVDPDAEIYIKGVMEFVSRGGLKLKKAYDLFNIEFTGKIVLDVGCSTGGFTDFALKHGAKKVFSIDVGKGVLDYSLRNDDRVVVKEGINFRNISFEEIGVYPDIIVGDLSFISLKTIYKPLLKFCKENTEVIFLIKPQFEASPTEVEKGGVVRNKGVYNRVLEEVINIYSQSFKLCGLTTSPIKGAKGNIEFLAFFVYCGTLLYNENIEDIIKKVVDEEYSYYCKTSC